MSVIVFAYKSVKDRDRSKEEGRRVLGTAGTFEELEVLIKSVSNLRAEGYRALGYFDEKGNLLSWEEAGYMLAKGIDNIFIVRARKGSIEIWLEQIKQRDEW